MTSPSTDGFRKRQRVMLSMPGGRKLPGTIRRVTSVAVYVTLDIGGVYRVPSTDVTPLPSRPDLFGAADCSGPEHPHTTIP